MSSEANFVEKVRNWKNFLEHVRQLNADDYLDYEIRELNISAGVGDFPKDSEYVVISTTEDYEIDTVGCRNLEELKELLLDRDGSWEVDSVWKDDKEVKFRKEIVVEI